MQGVWGGAGRPGVTAERTGAGIKDAQARAVAGGFKPGRAGAEPETPELDGEPGFYMPERKYRRVCASQC